MAQGSLKELDTHVEVARRIGLIDDDLCGAGLSDVDTVGENPTRTHSEL